MSTIKNYIKKIPEIRILPLEMEKTMMKDVEKFVLHFKSYVCTTVTKEPKCQHSNFVLVFSETAQFIRETFSTGDTEILLQVEKRRDKVLVLDYEKDFMQNENDTGLSLFSYVCETLAMDSEMKNGYILVSFPEGFQFLNEVARECPAPPTKELFSVFKRKFTRKPEATCPAIENSREFSQDKPRADTTIVNTAVLCSNFGLLRHNLTAKGQSCLQRTA
ncbi:Palmitoyl-protein hydrolase 1 [Apodemus speciosus]|uniref:Palmitoyl-protein hydrolase 1 n=1 Tax=Apodemus speciosus TaxID=105296 RepID=A0ABQ0FVW7_APOSI